jgi:thiol-disulfide isomerase/thioredoxin
MSVSGEPAPTHRQFQWGYLAALGIVVLGLVLMVIFRPTDHHHDGRHHPGVGQTLPKLALQPLTAGTPPITLADLSGKVVLLDFWGTWCPECRVQLPHIAELYKKYSTRPNFKLLAVSCGRGATDDLAPLRTKTVDYLKKIEVEVSMPIYADPNEATRTVVDKVARLDGYPMALLLDRHGVIRAGWTGFPSGREVRIAERMDQLVAELLAEK